MKPLTVCLIIVVLLAALLTVQAGTSPAPAVTPDSARIICPRTCGAMQSCAQAKLCLRHNPRLDGDKDGIPCETICKGG